MRTIIIILSYVLFNGCAGNIDLMSAINAEDVSTARRIIKGGYDVNVTHEYRQTALHIAASVGNTEIVRILIANGAEVNVKNIYKWTPLHKAAFSGNTEIARILIEHGAEVNVKSNSHWTPLHLAVEKSHAETVMLLLKHGAEVNAISDTRWTPLHKAAFHGIAEIVRILLEHGAEVNSKNKYEWTPLHLASDKGHTETVRLLIINGAHVNDKNESESTPLHLAALNGNIDTVKLLLANNAEVIAYNSSVKTPIDLARESMHFDTVHILEASKESPQRKIMHELPDIDNNIPTTSIVNDNAVAVIIGNKDYKNTDIHPVDFAINDAVTMVKYLLNVFGYKKENIIFITNAKRSDFESIFGSSTNFKGKLYNYLKTGESDIFIYYTGHGLPDPTDKEAYFVPSDGDPSAVKITGYPLKQLYLNMRMIAKEKAPPHVFIMIDAGFSGATEKGMLLKNMRPLSIDMNDPLIILPDAVVMTSSKGNEVSSWFTEKGHSMFSYFFLKAIKEKIESGNQTITAGEIFKHVASESEGVPYYAGILYERVQTPHMMGDERQVLLGR